MVSRRSFLQGAGIVGALSTFGLLSARDIITDSSTGAAQLEKITIALKNLPGRFEGYTIGFISDLHLGIWVPERWITHAIETVQAEGVQLLVLGGDYIGVPESRWWEQIGAVRNQTYAGIPHIEVIPKIFGRVAEILSGYTFSDGIFAVPGNHEHWNSTHHFIKAFTSSVGFTLLINEEFTVRRGEETLTFFGADDFLTGIPKLPRRSDLPAENARNANILVSHNPDHVSFGFRRDGELFPFSLSLSGHTHGGQVCIPGIGPITYQVNDRSFGSGLVSLNGRQSYTSRGLGVVGVPFRIACPPEITVIQLVRGE
jgi:predicted MPP superfamily phosphohydrolase